MSVLLPAALLLLLVVCRKVLVGVYFFVAVMGCLLGIKRFEYALLLLPLAVGVLVFHVLVRRRSAADFGPCHAASMRAALHAVLWCSTLR